MKTLATIGLILITLIITFGGFYLVNEIKSDINLPNNIFGNLLKFLVLFSPIIIALIVMGYLGQKVSDMQDSSSNSEISTNTNQNKNSHRSENVDRKKRLRKSYVYNQNDYYKKMGYNAFASCKGKTFRVIWNLRFVANKQGENYG